MQNSAFMFFITIYTHIFRGLYYTSYAYPKQLLWASAIINFLLMMATAFLGYVLPRGHKSIFFDYFFFINIFFGKKFLMVNIVSIRSFLKKLI